MPSEPARISAIADGKVANREYWLGQLQSMAPAWHWGGETCKHETIPPRSSDCSNSLAEAEQLHAVFLNREHDPEVLEAWRKSDFSNCWCEFLRRWHIDKSFSGRQCVTIFFGASSRESHAVIVSVRFAI